MTIPKRRRPSQLRRILDTLKESPIPITTTMLALAIRVRRSNVWVLLLQLERAGVVLRERPDGGNLKLGSRWVLKSMANGA